MARPISFNLQRVYPRLMEPWVTCGDSITALNASTPSALFGIAGAWPFLTWSGFCERGVYGQQTYVAFGNDTNTSTAVYAERQPGQTYTCFGSGYSAPVSGREWRWSANLSDGATIGFCDVMSGQRTISTTANSTGTTDVDITTSAGHRLYQGQSISMTHADSALNNKNYRIHLNTSSTSFRVQTTANPAASGAGTATVGSQWATLDWFASTRMAGRLIFRKDTSTATGEKMLPAFRLTGRRSGSVVATGSNVSAANADGITYEQIDIGSAAGYPGLGVITAVGEDEGNSSSATDGDCFNTLGYSFFKHDGSFNRTAGFYLCDISYSGWKTTDLLGALGSSSGTLTRNVDLTDTTAFLTANFSPACWMVCVGQNTTTTEATELAAGTKTEYKNNVAAIINQIYAVHASLGLSGKPFILLINTHNTGNTTIEFETRGDALFELAVQYDQVFFDMYAAMAKTPVSANGWATTDDTHLSPDGQRYRMGLLGTAIVQAYQTGSTGGNITGRAGGGRRVSRV